MKINAQLLVGLRSQSSLELHDPVLRDRRGGARHRQRARGLGRAEVARDRHPAGDGDADAPDRAASSSSRAALVGLGRLAARLALGAALALFFESLAKNPDGSPTFPVDLALALFLRAAAIATLIGHPRGGRAGAARGAPRSGGRSIRYG